VSVRSLAAIVACAAVAGGILSAYRVPNDGGGLGPSPEAQEAELFKLAGVAATTVACVTAPVDRVSVALSAIPKGERVSVAIPGDVAGSGPGGPTPATALASYLRGTKPLFPRLPYAPKPLSGNRVLFTYAVSGDVKVAITIGPNPVEPGYRWLQFAECDPEEASLAGDRVEVWSDKHGKPVSTRTIVGQAPLPGKDHCNGAGVSLLWLGRGQPFIRDPKGTFIGTTRSPYEAAATLPVDARDTGLRHGADALWLAGDKSAVFLVQPGNVERLPRETGERGFCVGRARPIHPT
jgi:hypothetical protein